MVYQLTKRKKHKLIEYKYKLSAYRSARHCG